MLNKLKQAVKVTLIRFGFAFLITRLFFMGYAIVNVKIQPEIAPYYMEFQRLTHLNPWKVSSEFSDTLEPGQLGITYPFIYKMKFDRFSWYMMEEEEKRALVFHELYHALGYYTHDEEELENGCPKTLMFPYSNPICTKMFQDKYEHEMKAFTNSLAPLWFIL